MGTGGTKQYSNLYRKIIFNRINQIITTRISIHLTSASELGLPTNIHTVV